jgi:ABC-2 type transport system permease protein
MIRRTFLTAWRVLMQLRHDPRTILLILAIPSVLITLLYYVFSDSRQLYDQFAPLLLGIFPFIMMFIVTSVATLRERMSGTLERLLTMPLRTGEFVLGYAIAFAVMACIQATLATFICVHWLGVSVAGGGSRLLLVAILSGIIGESLGLFVSAFANSEFQAVQFMPALVFPQFLTCGLFIERSHMAKGLQWFSDLLPLTYVAEAAKRVETEAAWSHALKGDLLVIAFYAVGVLLLSALTLRGRR